MLLRAVLRKGTRAPGNGGRAGVWSGRILRSSIIAAALGCQGTPNEAVALAEEPRPAERPLETGAVIDLGAEDAPSYAIEGFSLPEVAGSRRASWSEGEMSTVAFQLRGGAKNYQVTFLADPYHPLGSVPVGVAMNEQHVGDATVVDGWRAYRVVVPGDRVRAGRNELTFHFAKTGRPADLEGGSSDVRELGVRFEQIQVHPIGDHVELAFGSRSPLALAALGEGWVRDPSDRGTGTWTLGQRAVVAFNVSKSDAAVYRLELVARTPRGIGERSVALSLNGSPLGRLVFQEAKSAAGIDIPAARLALANALVLEFDRLEPPADVDPKSKDERLLGLRVFALQVAPK